MSKTVQIVVTDKQYQEFKVRQEEMQTALSGAKISLNQAVQSLIADRHLDKLTLVDLSASYFNISVELAEVLKELGRSDEHIVKVMLDFSQAIHYVRNKPV